MSGGVKAEQLNTQIGYVTDEEEKKNTHDES